MELLHSLLNVLIALTDLVLTLGKTLAPWTPLFVWIAIWLLAVNWVKLWPVLFKEGGWIGALLICMLTVLVWSVVAPPAEGVHHILGLKVQNLTGKLAGVTTLVCIALLCGTLQLSGLFKSLVHLDYPADEASEDTPHEGSAPHLSVHNGSH